MKKIIAIFGMSLILILTILSSGCVEEHDVEVKVSYSGSWSGCYGDTGSTTSVDGYGTKSYYLKNPDIVSAVFQKMDEGHGTLTVEIIDNGEVVESESTSATYGVVSVSHSFGYGGMGFFSDICFLWIIIFVIIGIFIYFLMVRPKPKKSSEELKPPVYQLPRQEIISEGKLYCPACGFGNKEGNKFCKKCGTKLTEERWRQSQKVSYPLVEETSIEKEAVTFEPVEKTKLIKVRCPACKHEMEVEDTGRLLEIVCEKCGAKGTLR